MGALDLSLVWAGILALAVLLYVLLDGFDLGVGILFPFAASDAHRDRMMAAVAPVWDGNETWLVLGGTGLLAVFPSAYAIMMPAFYMPVGFMLTALVFRGVAFELRWRASGAARRFWDQAFHWGSVTATFAQGLMLGSLVQGIPVEGEQFSGGTFDWLTPFSFVVGCTLVWGYVLLGATWLVIKTEGELLAWSRRAAVPAAAVVLVMMVVVGLWVLAADMPAADGCGAAAAGAALGPSAAAAADTAFGGLLRRAAAARAPPREDLCPLSVVGAALRPRLCRPAVRALALPAALCADHPGGGGTA